MLVSRDVSQTTKERESKSIQFTILVGIQFCLKDYEICTITVLA